jgi:hypothetical protein
VRGDEARPPRDLLTLRLPGPGTSNLQPSSPPAEQQAPPDFDPLKRGPEITEIR